MVTQVPLTEDWQGLCHFILILPSPQLHIKMSSVPGIVQGLHSLIMPILQVVKLRLPELQYFAHIHSHSS